jgi:uncharacterized protein YegL
MRDHMVGKVCHGRIERIIAAVLVVVLAIAGIFPGQINSVRAEGGYTVLYFTDNTKEKWVSNDGALIQAVDNSDSHKGYWMTKADDVTWKASVPSSSSNFTFNRYSPDKTSQWNSWSAGGRDGKNAYYADGSEYGHWENHESTGFKEGDVIFLDLSECSEWKNDGAEFYINFTAASKAENGGNDITISDADKGLYNPRKVECALSEKLYGYAVTKDDAGAHNLRFWRGDGTKLWNCSVSLSYDDFIKGKDCIKVTGWNDTGSISAFTYDNTDSDGDGLPDFIEDMMGLDKNNADTDGDSLPDGYEIFSNYSYPNTKDTDENGISDADEDTDNDGLSNYKEYCLGINPIDKDTDGDGLNDAVELKYNMNPNDQDTLDDGVMDGDRKFDLNITCDKSDNGLVTPEIEVSLPGGQLESFETEKLSNNDPFLNDQIPGYLGNGYEFYVDGNIKKAVLSFALDDKIKNDTSIDPTIYYWNEDTQLLEAVEGQYRDGDCIKANLQHFSKYILIDKNKYDKNAFKFTIEGPVSDEKLKKSFDVSFVLDESGSISESDFSEMKAQCADLAGRLNESDRVSVYTFDGEVRNISPFVSPKEAVNAINSITQHNGWTAIYDAVTTSAGGFDENKTKEKNNIIILLTDGIDNSSSADLNTAIEKANEAEASIYSVGVGSVDKASLTDLSQSTGGAFYSLEDFNKLEAVFNNIISKSDLYKDSDGDGISDYHEKKIAAGELMTGSGEKINFCKKMNYLSSDSDGDGLNDGDEIAIKKIPGTNNYYCYMYSNPCMKDTDLDSYDDNVEDYIGTSLISIKNVLKSVRSVDGLPSDFTFNTFEDWKELIKDEAWNYIHNAVEHNIHDRYNEIQTEFQINSSLRCDLFKPEFNEIWEVKPSSYAVNPKMQKGLDQLDRYVAAIDGGKRGGPYISSSSFSHGKYKVSYFNRGNGLIIYTFKNKNKKPNPVTVPKPEKEKEKGYKYVPKIAPTNGEIFVRALLALGLLAGTVYEDVLSGGVGITDDLASILIAKKLVFG